jgi:putative hydrolase of the HAD superfamily
MSHRALNQNFRRAWDELKSFRHTRPQWAQLVDATFDGLVEPPPSTTFFPQLYQRFSEPDAWQIFEDVLPTLKGLKARGIKLGIISNWDGRLRPLLQKLELAAFFEVTIVSCEIGACKPAGVLFTAACKGLNSKPDHTLHIGDSLAMDVMGARAAGLQAVHLRRSASRAGEGEATSLGILNKI